jgi:hypothetical protein
MIQRKIENGPSKLALMLGFFDKIHDDAKRVKDDRRPVEFKVEAFSKGRKISKPHKFDVVINELQWADGSGESWNFQGYIYLETFLNLLDQQMLDESCHSAVVRGHYNTASRKGSIRINPY